MKGLRNLNWTAVLFAFAIFYGCAEEIDKAKLEESGEIDSEIADHASDPSAHHEKTTDALEITSGVFDPVRIPDLDASVITSGSFDPARIPNLDASKIGSGTLNTGRIPDLDAGKITTGVFDSVQIPNLDASVIMSGTFDPAHIPDLDASIITSGTLDPARIPAIMRGIFVVDGNGDTIGRYLSGWEINEPVSVYLDQFRGVIHIKFESDTYVPRILTPNTDSIYFTSVNCSGLGFYPIPFVGESLVPGFGIVVNPITGEVYGPTGNELPPDSVSFNSRMSLVGGSCEGASGTIGKTVYEVQVVGTVPFTLPFVTPLQLEHR